MDALFLRGGILFEAGRPAEALPLFVRTIDYGEEVQNARIVARGVLRHRGLPWVWTSSRRCWP